MGCSTVLVLQPFGIHLDILVSAIALVVCLVKFKSLHNFVEIIVYAACFYSLTIFVIAIIRDIVPWAMDVAKGLPIIGSVIQYIRYGQRFFLYTGILY